MTKPSRRASKGRDAPSGSKPVERARRRQKPAMLMGSMHASAPPASMMSALPYSMHRIASPMACEPAAQAVEAAWLGPCKPYSKDSLPAAEFARTFGTKCGLSRRRPLSSTVCRASETSRTPDMPLPIQAPIRDCLSQRIGFSRFVSSHWCNLDISIASAPATSAICTNLEVRSFGEGKFFTGDATWQGKVLATLSSLSNCSSLRP
mmetsp:Transcript_41254/g.118678  ORF Transcript_41254/g.118678 Transcript_41254/m.118678 type:complete len:206 (+) Transcript_41254:621-1238(+)